MEYYEKKYKEALEWARKVMQGKIGFVYDEVLEKFPELKESEDEKIRKTLISQYQGDGCLCNFGTRISYKDIVAWLEKQKPEWSEKDEARLSVAIDCCERGGKNAIGNWLKSIRPQKQWKPDGDQLDALYDMIRSFKKESSYSNRDDIANIVDTLFEQLKEL